MLNFKKILSPVFNCLIFIDADIIARHFYLVTLFQINFKHNVRFVFPSQKHKRINSLDFKNLNKNTKLTLLTMIKKRLSL